MLILQREKNQTQTLYATREIESELMGDSSGHPKSKQGRAIMLHEL
jgi:hypothetical protein